MLFTEQELNYINPLNILEEATYLSEDESIISPATIPVTEVSRLGYGIVRFDDVDKLSEDYGIDYIDAMYAIAEASDMDPEYLAVSVPEEDIIACPEIVNELANIVVQPLSEDDDEYQFVAECVDAWLESGDEDYLEYITEAADYDTQLERVRQIQMQYDQEEQILKNANSTNSGYTQKQLAQRQKALLKLGQKLAKEKATLESLRKSNIFHRKNGTGAVQSNYTSFGAPVANVGKSPISLERKERGARHYLQNYERGGDSFGRLGRDVKEIWNSEGNARGKIGALGYAIGRNKKTAMKIGGGIAAGAALAGGLYAYKQYKNKPKSVIGKRIAALRGIYKNFMQQAQRNPQKAGMLKSIAAKILSVIDKLMGYLQNAAG